VQLVGAGAGASVQRNRRGDKRAVAANGRTDGAEAVELGAIGRIPHGAGEPIGNIVGQFGGRDPDGDDVQRAQRLGAVIGAVGQIDDGDEGLLLRPR